MSKVKERFEQVLHYIDQFGPMVIPIMIKYKCLVMYHTVLLQWGNSKVVCCMFCGLEGNSFYPDFVAGKIRQRTVCPRCKSLPRYRALNLFISKENCITKNTRVLEIGALKQFSVYCRGLTDGYIGADNKLSDVDVNMDIENIPFKDNSFDVIICYHVLCFVKNDKSALKEMLRCLKPDGKVLLQDPFNNNIDCTIEYAVPNYLRYGYIRQYGSDYFSRIRSVGFRIETIKVCDFIEKEEINKNGLYSNEEIYILRKM